MTDAVIKLRKWTTLGKRLIVLAGRVRTGKSLAAAGWLADQDGAVYWVSAPRLCATNAWSDEAKRAKAADFLVIDDMGLGSETQKGLETLETLIYERYGYREKITVITTNLKREGKGQFSRYSDRIQARLDECGAFVICRNKENQNA